MFKKLKTNKWTAILVTLVLVTSLFVGGTIARYVTSTSSEDEARVAVWGINTGGEEMDLFDSEYLLDGSTNEYKAKSADDEKIIAPGLSGMSEFKIIEAKKAGLAPEVMYEVIISLDDSEIADEIKNHPGIEWKVDNGEWGTWEEFKTSLLSLSGDPSGMKVYAPGVMATEFANGKEHTVAWQWIMDSGYDVEDTAMGNYAAKVGDITAKLSINITARQTDIDTTGMLEGNGQVYDINNPTPLVFRSAAPLNELQSVKVGDDTLTQGSEYTTASGSTVVTLTDSYLSNLEIGSYTISIISTSMTAKANFTVNELPDPLVHSGTIPKGGTYYVGVTSTTLGNYNGATQTLTANDEFPEPSAGDVYVYGDYEYRWQQQGVSGNDWNENDSFLWGVKVLDKTKSSYEDILKSINNIPIDCINGAFQNCTNLKYSPKIPNTVKSINWAYQGCTSLLEVPNIPNGVTGMANAFENCKSLTHVPELPDSIVDMYLAFSGCENIETITNLPANLWDGNNMFSGCKALKSIPTIPNNVVNLGAAFSGCTSLTSAPAIPASVSDLGFTFYGCTNLEGSIEINTNQFNYNYQDALYGTKITEITGDISSENAAKILATKTGEY